MQWLKWKMDIGGSQFFPGPKCIFTGPKKLNRAPNFFVPGPKSIFTGPQKLNRAPHFFDGPHSRPYSKDFYELHITKNTLFPFRAQLATGGGGGANRNFPHPKSIFFPFVHNSRPGGGLCRSSGYHLPTTAQLSIYGLHPSI